MTLACLVLATQVIAACSTSPDVAQTVTPQSTGDIAGSVAVQALGLNVPWAVGGLRLERDGSTKMNGGDWPTAPFRSLRLWDTRSAWLHLEPARGQFEFDQLDSLVDKARSNGITDITLVLGGTPQWAASSVQPTDASWLGPGSASMPADLGAWQEFVTRVAQRYAGQITAYEIGNEPNLRTFWSGTAEQYAQFVTSAASAIRAADPAATVLFNGGLVRSKYDIATLPKWLGPLAPAVQAGLLDAASLHYYPQATQLDEVGANLKAMRAALAANGFASLPTWMTEVNVRSAPTLSPQAQTAAIVGLARQMVATGFDRAYWYAWTDMSADDLVAFQPNSSGAVALATIAGVAAPVGPSASPSAVPQTDPSSSAVPEPPVEAAPQS